MSYDYEDVPQERDPEATPQSVKVNATTVEYSARAMFDAIAQNAAAQIVEQIRRDLVSEVGRSVQAQIAQQVGAIVSQTLDGTLQPTNEWGEPKGKPISLRDMVADAARKYLGEKVDKEGRANNYNADSDRLSFIVKKQVEAVFTYQMQSEVKKAVEQARNEAVARVGGVVGDLILKLRA